MAGGCGYEFDNFVEKRGIVNDYGEIGEMGKKCRRAENKVYIREELNPPK